MSQRTFAIEIRSGARRIVAVSGFALPENCITFLFGESGIGKSMLCKAVYGLLDPGEVDADVNGRPYIEHCRDPWTKAVQTSGFFVFQEPSSHLNPLLRLREQLTEGSLTDVSADAEILRRLWQTADDAAMRAILEVYPKPYRPSGGEKQRVLLAMAFKKIARHIAHPAAGPNLFVFDEPTGSLDDQYRNIFLRLLFDQFARKPFSTVVITHDYSMISEVCRQYPQHRSSIVYKELTRTGEGTVALRDFSAHEYLSWIQQARPAGNSDSTRVVLEMSAEAAIFGRRLRICRDAKRSHPAALRVMRGAMAYLKAPSGVGKTTIAKIIAGLYRADAFTMTLCGKTISERTAPAYWQSQVWGRRVGMVFQHADEALNLQATVRETFKGLPGKDRRTDSAIRAALGTLFTGQISDAFLNKKVALLSGGQKQRLNLLRTLILDTDVVILDEPLNGLDFSSVKKVVAMLEEKLRQDRALIMISHNEEIFDALVAPQHVYYLAAD